ncbi:MAG: nucleotidyltransferase family protein [Proteobacteria bacterium]|nr:nucleotidyltransferase family protein [Pseudomonadota bacterium]
MTLDRALGILRANKDSLRAKGILHAAVFGSVARGEAKSSSDVDVMVELDPESHMGVYQFVGIQLDLEDLFGRKVDLIEAKALKPFAVESAMQDRVNAF